ncbi:MAG: hypothetical protein LC620_06235, partial [Halobacteriales archaeon]|nr:hypothetical protein [Halobacteriales archaeon]
MRRGTLQAAQWLGRVGLVLVLVASPVVIAGADTRPLAILGPAKEAWSTNETIHSVAVADGQAVVFGGPAAGIQWLEIPGRIRLDLHGYGGGNIRSVIVSGPFVAWHAGVLDVRSGALYRVAWPVSEGPKAGWNGTVYGMKGSEPWAYDLASNRSVPLTFAGDAAPKGAPAATRMY